LIYHQYIFGHTVYHDIYLYALITVENPSKPLARYQNCQISSIADSTFLIIANFHSCLNIEDFYTVKITFSDI